MPLDASLSELQERADPAPALPSDRQRTRDDNVSLLDIFIVLAERKRVIFSVAVVFAVLAIVVSLVLPKRYTATTSLLPPQQNSSLGAALTSQLGNLGGMGALASGTLGLRNPNDIFVAMLRSRTVEDAMVQKFGLAQEYHKRYLSDARKAFETRSIVDGSSKTGIIYVSVIDRDPSRAAELANGYVDQFRKLSERLAITEASQRRLFFEKQLEQAKDNLASAEEALKLTEQKTGLIQLDSQARVLIESAESLRAQIAAKEVQIESLHTFATSENSQLIQAQQELEGLRAQLAKLGGSETVDSGLMLPKGQVPTAGLEYVRKLRDVKYSETIFEILARQFEIAKLDEAKQGALVQVVDAAIVPDLRSFPKRALIVIGATAIGFFVGLIVAVIQESLLRAKSTPEVAHKMNVLRNSLSFRRRRTS
jgi:tyrosine-protein kinase Etk/Wzc